jgi:Uma2 family endonuclease
MAIILKHPRPVTDEEILELSRLNPGYQFERTATGELVVTPTSGRSGHLEARLVRQLDTWADGDGHGLVFNSTTGFVLPDGAFVLPDAAWLRRDRWEALGPDAQDEILRLCPDATFEIRAKSSRPAELRDKMRAYIANGAQLAVLIDPYERTVEVYRPGREPAIHQGPTAVALDPELPGFVLDLRPVFEV